MLHNELLRPLPGQTLAHLACIVGGEGALAVQLGIPVGSGCFHLGVRGCKALLFCHQQKPQPAAQLALCLRVEPCTELFHRLAAHFKELVKVDAIGLQANGINFDQFLKVRGQTVEEFRAWLHAQAERKLRSWLGLLLVAEKEGLAPTDAEVEAAAAHWDAKLDGERTFPANDARKVRQRLARERAEQFIVEHSTLTPPPDEPIVQKVESK